MRVAVALASIPVVVWAVWPAPPKPMIVAQAAIEIEGVRAVRQDDETFRRRFEPVSSMPPAIEARYIPGGEVVSTVPATVDLSPPAQRPSRGRLVLRSKPVRLDICVRHRMHKVFYGRTWRCRR